MLKRDYRLSDRHAVARVYRGGRSVRGGTLAVRYLANRLDQTRLAVVVSKKTAKSAPLRNRLRRRVFETVRHLWPDLRPGYDIIITVHDQAFKDVPPAQLAGQVAQLLSKAGLTKSKR